MARRAQLCDAVVERRERVRNLEIALREARDRWLDAVEIAKTAGISYTEAAELSGIHRSAITQALQHWRANQHARPIPAPKRPELA